jgi:hypothetical protein
MVSLRELAGHQKYQKAEVAAGRRIRLYPENRRR